MAKMKTYASDRQELAQENYADAQRGTKEGRDFYSAEMVGEATFESTTGKNVSQVSYRKGADYPLAKKGE